MELNELRWWGNWAALEKVGTDAYLLSTKEMQEVFFNRGAVMHCASAGRAIDAVEKRLQKLGRPPAVMVFDHCRETLGNLRRRGYDMMDAMTVMAAERVRSSEATVQLKRATSAGAWSEAYLSAFYGDLELLPTTRKKVRKILTMQEATLLEGRMGTEVVGTLALFRTEGLAGVYCVGTVPAFRGRGVAGALLSEAWRIASDEGRTLFLQTLDSDGARPFYVKRGFRALYRKRLMVKKVY